MRPVSSVAMRQVSKPMASKVTPAAASAWLMPDRKIFLPEYEARLIEALSHTELAVTLRDGRPVLIYSGAAQEQELKEKLRPLMARLPRGQQLTAILITDDPLPRTATGKIKRWEVQQKAGLL